MVRHRYMPWGKHRDKELRDIPRNYLAFIVKKCPWIDAELEADIRAAIDGTPYPASDDEQVEMMVKEWRKENTLHNGVVKGVPSSSVPPSGGRGDDVI